MLQSWKKAAFAAVLAVGAMTAATSAEARDRYYGRDNDAALAIGAGVIGLALGAAIASDRDDRYYRGDRYYRSYPRGDYYYHDRAPRGYYRDYPRYDRRDWRDGRRDRGRDRYYRRGW